MTSHGPAFKDYINRLGIKKTKLAKDLGMSPQNLYQLFQSSRFTEDTIKKIEKLLQVQWADIETTYTINIDSNNIDKKNSPGDNPDYKDKYIALLEQQVQDRDRQLSELKDRMDSRTIQITDQIEKLQANLAAHDRIARLALGYCKFLYQRWGPVEYRLNQLAQDQKRKVPEAQEKRDLKRVLDDLDKLLIPVLEAELTEERGN